MQFVVCVCVCVCVCARARLSVIREERICMWIVAFALDGIGRILGTKACVYASVCVRLCVCVCVTERESQIEFVVCVRALNCDTGRAYMHVGS